jgi:hypothetical protein
VLPAEIHLQFYQKLTTHLNAQNYPSVVVQSYTYFSNQALTNCTLQFFGVSKEIIEEFSG